MNVRKIYGEVFSHESEDVEKVKKAFEVFFPKKEIKEKIQKVGFGIKVRILNASLEKRKAKILVKKILDSLSRSEKEKIIKEINLRLNSEGKLYLRFDKQIAYEKKKIKLSDEEDSIQIVFYLEAFPSNYFNYLKTAKELFSQTL